MWMMRFIVKGGVPFKVFHWYFEILCNCRRLCTEHIPPPLAGIVAETFGVLPAKGNNDSPHIAAVLIQFFRDFIQLDRYTVVSK